MPTPKRQDPKPEQRPARLTGDLNAPYVRIKFEGVFPELVGVGDSWTVELTSRYLAMASKESIPNTEIDALFGDAFAAANPDVELKGYTPRLQWRAVQELFLFRAGQVETTTEIVRNEPAKIQSSRRVS